MNHVVLKDWVLVATQGLELVGKPHPTQARLLQPVFQLLRPIVHHPTQQSLAMPLQIIPFMGLGAPCLRYPEGSIVVGLDAFYRGSEEVWEKLLEHAEKVDQMLRGRSVQASGLITDSGVILVPGVG